MQRLVGKLCLIFGVLALPGCPEGQVADKPQGQELVVPEVESEPVTLPADFPQDVPIYDGATLAASAVEGNGYFVELVTSDAPWQVMRYYQTRLRDFGWEVSKSDALDIRSGEASALKESRLFMLVCRGTPGETRVMLSVADVTVRRGS